MTAVPILLLKEGTEQAQGKRQIVSNIQACQAIADSVRTTLGPRGMDKLIADDKGKSTISNDGATILKLLDIQFPAAKMLVDIAKSQDAEVGDGTTSVVLLASEFLKNAKPFVEEGVHPQIIIQAYRKAARLAVQKIKDLAEQVKAGDKKLHREMLVKCAMTTLSSKLVATQKEFFGNMVVDAVGQLDERLPLNMIGIKKVHGGSLEESKLVLGVAFKKTFSYAGFEMQQKSYKNPKIAMLNIELELKAERDNAEIRVDNVQEYQQIVDAEWTILYEKMQKMYESGVNIVLSKLPIGDVATQWFADRNMFCAGRVSEEDLQRTMEACGGSIQTSVNNLQPENLGTCELFVEEQIGNERYNLFTGCPKTKTCTFILRGGAEQFIDETERGGAIEMEISKYLRDVSRSIAGKEQLLISAFARSFEVIPRELANNAGFDATDILNKLRQKHAQGRVAK
uniref:T-complex protein 1 subunit eta n=1 Tax=Romanomermis culicivorax TaxID=13658 RepID=A0A915KGR8_ROMCU